MILSWNVRTCERGNVERANVERANGSSRDGQERATFVYSLAIR